MNLTKNNFQLQWNPETDESYIKIVGIDSMERDHIIKQILECDGTCESCNHEDADYTVVQNNGDIITLKCVWCGALSEKD